MPPLAPTKIYTTSANILPQDFCATVQSVRAMLVNVIDKFLRKKVQLLRLAELLMAVADNLVLPDPTSLIPLNLIDVTSYNLLRSTCPMLGLPAIADPSAAELAQLRATVAAAYQRLIDAVYAHPYAQLQKLQDTLYKYANEVDSTINSVMGTVNPYFDCIDLLCSVTVADAQMTVYNNFSALVTSTGSDVTEYGNLLTDQMRSVAVLSADSIDTLDSLLTTI